MLIAEALAERKDIIKRVREFPSHLAEMSVWDEDDDKPSPAEIGDLRTSVQGDLDRLQHLNIAINRANNELLVETENGKMTVMEAIALRDRLVFEQRVKADAASHLNAAIEGDRWSRRSKEDIKRSTLVAPREMSREEDALAGQVRRLDLAIQQVNWTQELPE